MSVISAEDYILQNTSIMTMAGNKQKVAMAMKEFAKLHVEAALKEAAEKVKHYSDIVYEDPADYTLGVKGSESWVDEESILFAYPITNIK